VNSKNFKPFQTGSKQFKPKNHRPLMNLALRRTDQEHAPEPNLTRLLHNTTWRGFINKKSLPLISYARWLALPCPHVRKSRSSSRPHLPRRHTRRRRRSSLDPNRPNQLPNCRNPLGSCTSSEPNLSNLSKFFTQMLPPTSARMQKFVTSNLHVVTGASAASKLQ